MTWSCESLGELSEVITKGTTPTTLGYKFASEGIPFLRAQNIADGRVEHERNTLFIDVPTHQALRRSHVRAGDILVSIAGTIGRAGVVSEDAPAMNCNQAVAIVRVNESVSRQFLRHWLQSDDAQRQIRSSSVTGTISNLSLQQVGSLRVPVPPIVKQRRIAEVLDRAETLRAQRRQALAQLDALAESIFLDMFGDPSRNEMRWDVLSLAKLFGAPPIFGTMIPPKIDGGRWLSLRVANIQDWQLDLTDKKFVELPPPVIARHSVADGDMLMARAIASIDHLGKAVIAYPGTEHWAFDSHLMRIRLDRSKAEPAWLRQALMTSGGRALFLKAARRTAVQFNINTKEMAALRIPVPPIEMQRMFVARLAAVDSLRRVQLAALSELDALFASLQHRAFRGEL